MSKLSILHIRRRLTDSRGNALVEFALLFPLLLLVLFGITEFGRALSTVQTLNAAAREGARIAMVTSPDADLVNARVNEVLTAAGITPTAITIAGPDGTAESTVQVTVQADFDVLTGSILGTFSGTIPLSGSAVMRHEG
jgi:Flp pilus assembly protein TadG